ncbi:hypothetical protein M433DRAFT_155881 [Acidomyces richmondensis BFW]|nr:MAG: hypothetical protein FE78DRAFT_92595 [Acidomyces sp. 'richmondensis']KYG44194.1 hypothetical protein M433DRAFT_155881 [Acidomyces richmondensis BFW]
MSFPNKLLQLWAARLASKIAICSAMTYDLYQLSKARGKDGSIKFTLKDDKRRQWTARSGRQKRTVEDVFIESLVEASFCRHHSTGRPLGIFFNRRPHLRKEPRASQSSSDGLRYFSNRTARGQKEATQPDPGYEYHVSKEEYKDLVNTYGPGPDVFEPSGIPARPPLAPRLVISPEKEDQPPFAPRTVLPPEDEDHARRLKIFRRMLDRKFGYISHSKLWTMYQSLRAPRLRYISDDDVRRIFQHLTWIQHKNNEGAMARYMTFLEDCIGEDVRVTTQEWNTAIAFAGLWVRRTSAREVKGAVDTWLRMENSGFRANHITFNILFDVAIRANRFALADIIHKELEFRKLPKDQYFRTTLIYYAGIRGDGEAVRQAFRDLVNAEELIDTSIMNCVILSLIRAGEPSAAEHVFAKMKRLHEQKLGADSVRRWQNRRMLMRERVEKARLLRKERQIHEASFFGSPFSLDQRRDEMQKTVPIAPDAWTYRILIQHHVYTTANLDRIHELLAEMEDRSLEMGASVYIHLLCGFWRHGGYSDSAWTRARLEALWEYWKAAEQHASARALEAADEDGYEYAEDGGPPSYSRRLALNALKAFYRCAGKAKMLQVWEEIRATWKGMHVDDEVTVQTLVDRLVAWDNVYIVES